MSNQFEPSDTVIEHKCDGPISEMAPLEKQEWQAMRLNVRW